MLFDWKSEGHKSWRIVSLPCCWLKAMDRILEREKKENLFYRHERKRITRLTFNTLSAQGHVRREFIKFISDTSIYVWRRWRKNAVPMKIHDSSFSLSHFSILTGLLLQPLILENGYLLDKTWVLVKTGICWIRHWWWWKLVFVG